MSTLLHRDRPPGIRTQMTLWYTGVFALILLLAGGALYATLERLLASGFDTALQVRTEQIGSGISISGHTLTVRDVTGELPGSAVGSMGDRVENASAGVPETNALSGGSGADEGRPTSDVNFGALVRVLDATGHTVYVSPPFLALNAPPASVSAPLRGGTWRGTVTAPSGQQVRLYSAPLSQLGTVFGIVQVGEPLSPLTETLHTVEAYLLFIVPFILVLSAGGSYWLAGRAFSPIKRLTRTARDIEAKDLRRRLPVPRAHDEVRELVLTLNEMIDRLDRAFALQRRFVADASHELRTPVAAIQSLTDVALLQEAPPEEYRTILRRVNAQSERLRHLISDLLALARADEGQTVLESEPVCLELLALEAVAIAEPLARERDIRIEVQVRESATIVGDEARLMQAVMNVLDNAIRFTPPGGRVVVTIGIRDDRALLSVADTGVGIAPEHQSSIFDRFYRIDAARSRKNGGSGLGLAIADWLVRAHGGTIVVESDIGQGATFAITLPLPASLPGGVDDRLAAERDNHAAAANLPLG